MCIRDSIEREDRRRTRPSTQDDVVRAECAHIDISRADDLRLLPTAHVAEAGSDTREGADLVIDRRPAQNHVRLAAHAPRLLQHGLQAGFHECRGRTVSPVSYTHLDVYKRQLPSLPPKHDTLTDEVMEDVNNVGSVIVTVAVVVQAIASVTVTLYVPADRLLLISVVVPFDQL